jgi:hypothetical protein
MGTANVDAPKNPYAAYQSVRQQVLEALRKLGREYPEEWEIDHMIESQSYRLSDQTMDLLKRDKRARNRVCNKCRKEALA